MGKLTNFMQKKQVEEVPEESEEIEEIEVIDINALLKEEISAVLEELNFKHSDTDDYTKSVQNLATLLKAYADLTKADSDLLKAENEKIKVSAQLEEAKKRKAIDYSTALSKIASVCVYGSVMMFWLGVEQQRPTPQKLVALANNLLMPKGL